MKKAARYKNPELIAETLAVLFLAAVVSAANALSLFYILFPELGAIATDVLLRPNGKWAKEPWKLVMTPTVTGAVGILVGNYMPYGVISILITMTASIGIIFALRSSVAPAISAGVLPIVLGVTSWLYPLCILGTLIVLTATLLAWKRTPPGIALMPDVGVDRKAIEILESSPRGKGWLVPLYLFVAILGIAAQVTGWRFLLFPPLIVIAYEMLGHPETCPWAKSPFTFPVVCYLTALVGVGTDLWLGVTPLAVGLVSVVSLVILRLSRLRMPPAIAIGLIPFVLKSPTLQYSLSVGLGTVALTAWFLVCRRVTLARSAY